MSTSATGGMPPFLSMGHALKQAGVEITNMPGGPVYHAGGEAYPLCNVKSGDFWRARDRESFQKHGPAYFQFQRLLASKITEPRAETIYETHGEDDPEAAPAALFLRAPILWLHEYDNYDETAGRKNEAYADMFGRLAEQVGPVNGRPAHVVKSAEFRPAQAPSQDASWPPQLTGAAAMAAAGALSALGLALFAHAGTLVTAPLAATALALSFYGFNRFATHFWEDSSLTFKKLRLGGEPDLLEIDKKALLTVVMGMVTSLVVFLSDCYDPDTANAIQIAPGLAGILNATLLGGTVAGAASLALSEAFADSYDAPSRRG